MSPCLTLSIIRHVSRVKWINPENGVALSPTPRCSSYWKESLRVTLDCGRQLYFNQLISLVGRVFTNGPGDRGSIPGRVIPKTLKMVLDISLFNTQHYKVRIKGKVEQSGGRSSPPSPTPIEKGAFGEPLTTVVKFTLQNFIKAIKRPKFLYRMELKA